jgi:hypothetical protein
MYGKTKGKFWACGSPKASGTFISASMLEIVWLAGRSQYG